MEATFWQPHKWHILFRHIHTSQQMVKQKQPLLSILYLHSMKVYLIKTPEYETESFREVSDLLSSFDGALEFVPSFYEFDKKEFYFLRYELFPHHNFEYPSNDTAIKFDPDRGNPLSWRELFSLCSFYREVFKIEDESFVVLLTKRKNALNWFSATDESNNIFVHTAEWEQYTKVNSKYPIAYQVIENIMQTLMNIDIANVPNEYVHEPLKGCMNDFCNNKTQIIIKLQTANICDTCVQKIKDEKVDTKILKQARTIFNGIRNEFVFQGEEPSTEPISIIVDKNGKILLPEQNLEIRLTPLFKTLYLFFLSKNEGVRLKDLSDYKEDLLKIYKKIRPSVEREKAEKSIKELSHPEGETFNSTRAHINRIITELLNEPLADFYRITGEKGKPYSVKVPRNLIDIRY